MVLVRDWQSSADVGYGLIGGQRILDKILKVVEKIYMVIKYHFNIILK